LKGGLNLSTLGGDATNVESRTGFHVGAYAGAKMTKFGVDGEILFSRQGTQGDGASTFEIDNDYLLIPILGKFYIVKGLNIYAGPQFGILLNSEFTDTANGIKDQDIKDFSNSSDVSIVVGAGFEILKFRAGLRYNIGLSDLNDDPAGQFFTVGEELTNQVFQIFVGIDLIGK
ncbi:porin family protein, partial [Streptococcus pseudopneumoniae]|uniref:porin family protein n=1 Tax=Streptococcus pseudopneumoniae TaxID=257758 RepID=UPI00110C3C3B